MNNKRWSEEELQYLLNNIKDKPDDLFEKFSIEFENLRTYSAFKEKRTQLIRKYNIEDCWRRKRKVKAAWTEEEDEFLTQHLTVDNYTLLEEFEKKCGQTRSKKAIEVRRGMIRQGQIKNVEVDINIKKVDPKKVAYRERMIQRAKTNNRNERLKDFNDLIPNKDYSFKNIGPRKWKQGKYLYMNDYSLYFRTKHGFVETLPRNRNLIHIKDGETGQPVCRHIKLSNIDRV